MNCSIKYCIYAIKCPCCGDRTIGDTNDSISSSYIHHIHYKEGFLDVAERLKICTDRAF